MESPTRSSFKVPEAPGTPLRPLSSDQINQQRSNTNLAPSPMLHSYGAEGASRNCSPRPRESMSSAVQEKVALLNSLSGTSGAPLAKSPLRRDAMNVSPSKRDALERTMCGYEESQKLIASANAEIEQLRYTIKGQAKQLNMAAGRIEKLLEQLANERQQNEDMRLKYVQEVKKVRKQCFQAEKAQLELQEEVKETKKELRKKEAELAHAKQRKEEAKQEAFERAYAVAGVTEEMETLKKRLKVMEQEKDAAVQELRNHTQKPAGRIEKNAPNARRRAHERERIVARLQTLLGTPPDSAASGIRKQENVEQEDAEKAEHHCHQSVSLVPRPFVSGFVECEVKMRELDEEPFTLEDHIAVLYTEVAFCRRELKEARELIDFMCLQCQLQICSCRTAETQGKRYIHDAELDVMVQKMERERIAKNRRLLEEDSKARMLPPVPSVDLNVQLDHEEALEEARHVPLPEREELRASKSSKSSKSLESTPTATAALENMTQVLVAPTRSQADLKLSFSQSVPPKAHTEQAIPVVSRAGLTLSTSETADIFDLSPPKNQPPRPSTALGVRSSDLVSPIRLVPESPGGATTINNVGTAEQVGSSSRRVALRDADGIQGQNKHRRAHSRPRNIGSELRGASSLATVTNSEPDRGRSRTPGSPANSSMFAITPKVKGGRSMHARSQTHAGVPLVHSAQSFTTTTTTTRVPLRSDGEATLQQRRHGHDELEDQQAATTTTPATLNNNNNNNDWGTPVISREAALEQIRARRDRARSVNVKTTSSTRSRSTNGAASSSSSSSSSNNNPKSAPSSAKRVIVATMSREVSVASMMSAPGRYE